jgi:hypothetical protein
MPKPTASDCARPRCSRATANSSAADSPTSRRQGLVDLKEIELIVTMAVMMSLSGLRMTQAASCCRVSKEPTRSACICADVRRLQPSTRAAAASPAVPAPTPGDSAELGSSCGQRDSRCAASGGCGGGGGSGTCWHWPLSGRCSQQSLWRAGLAAAPARWQRGVPRQGPPRGA